MKVIRFALPIVFNLSLASLSFGKILSIRITDESDYCFIFPKTQMTIGESEDGGNDKVSSFCTKPQVHQRQLSDTIWTNGGPNIDTKKYHDGSVRWIQITGCFDPSKISTLDPNDDGGQYDSNGGDGGNGNPTDSKCEGYNSYVELVEPNNGRLCARCCMNPADCPIIHDEDGCESVIYGKYC